MMGAGLWKSRPRKVRKKHCWRERRSCCGELVQWDTSTHDWIEGRGTGVRYLVRLMDDATSRSWGRFVPADGTRENMGVLWEYIERNGRPVEVYTDRHRRLCKSIPLFFSENRPGGLFYNRPTMGPLLLHSVSYAGLWGQASLTLDQFIDKAAELGFEGVMLMAKRPHLSVLDYNTEACARLKSHLESRNLRT